MRPVSKKRAVLQRLYTRKREAFLDEHPHCARCGERSLQVHHMAGRIGALLLDDSKWLAVCGWCHQWLTEHPAQAIADGHSLPRVGQAS